MTDHKLFETIIPLKYFKLRELEPNKNFYFQTFELTTNKIIIYSNINGTICKIFIELVKENDKLEGLAINDFDKFDLDMDEKYIYNFINFLKINNIFEIINKEKIKKIYNKLKFQLKVIVDNGNLGNSIFFHGFIGIIKLLNHIKLLDDFKFYFGLVFNYTIKQEFSYFQSINEYDFQYSNEIIIITDGSRFIINKFPGQTINDQKLKDLIEYFKIEMKNNLEFIKKQIFN